MKKILIFLVAVVAVVSIHGASAQSRSSYFMEGSYFRSDLNPALVPTRGYVALPGIGGVGVNVSNNFFSVDNFVYQRDNQLVTAFHESVSADEFLGKLPSTGKFAADVKTNIFGVGFYTNKTFWTLGVNANISTDMAMSMDAFKAVKSLGNGTYDLGNTALEVNGYLDIYLGSSFRVHENVNVGFKAKFLVGLASLDAQFSELKANVSPESVNAKMRGVWRANAILLDNSNIAADKAFAIGEMMRFDIDYMLGNIKHFGVAFDLGAEVRLLDDHLKLSAAVTDLGFIRWSANQTCAVGTLDGDFTFNGMNLETQDMDMDYDFRPTQERAPANEKYNTTLNFSVNAGVEYNFLNNHIAFGLLSHNKFCNTMSYSELIASVNLRPTNWLSATVSHTFMNKNRPGIFGVALNIHPRVLNIYAGLDFIDTKWVNGPTIEGTQIPLPRYMKSINAYVGVGFNFARPKFLRPEKSVRVQ